MNLQLDQRLRLIEMYLLFWGRVQRKDLCRHFDIGAVTASRVLKAYIDQYPDNLFFDVSQKAYVISEDFIANYDLEIEAALKLLAYGVESRSFCNKTYGPPIISSFTSPLNVGIVSVITRAVVAAIGVKVTYISASGEKARTVYPHSVFQSGSAWYFRGYDSDRSLFRTFRFSRITGVLSNEREVNAAKPVLDVDWNQEVILTLSPHERHPSREALEFDLGLQGRPVTNYTVKRALAGFLLIDLRADCTYDASLDPHEYPLQLRNRMELLEVESMNLAPGFSV